MKCIIIKFCYLWDVYDFKLKVKELVRYIEFVLGLIDILVNNVGVMYYIMMKNLKED